jgi:uncharacterized protein YdaU (DUF1376 family)
MTKPNTFYFSHDYTARSDEKIKLLIMEHGMLGYGIYWAIIEDLYQNANALQTHYKRIAFELRADEKVVKSIVNDFDLFVFDGETFGSLSIQRRIDDRNSKSTKARESALYRWDKMRTQCEQNANALRTECESNAIKERKGKEKKRKEIKKEKQVKENSSHALHDGLLDGSLDSELPYKAIRSDLTNDNDADGISISTEGKSFVKSKKSIASEFHNEIIKAYSDWIKSRNLPVRIDGGDVTSVKRIVAYLSQFEVVKEGKKTPVDLLNYIFENWDKLSSWLQTQTQLRQINSQLPTIIESIKTKSNGKQNQQDHYKQFSDLSKAIRESIAGSKDM